MDCGRFRRIVRTGLLEPRRDVVDGNSEQNDERAGKQILHPVAHSAYSVVAFVNVADESLNIS